MVEPAVRLDGIGKSFGAARALEGASLVLQRGRVHAVVGENGAGKSTLLKIAAGVIVADEGSVLVGGTALSPPTVREAIRRGVGMVHQHFMLVPTLTALENLALGDEPTRGPLLDLRPLAARVRALLERLGLTLPLDVPVERLGVGERQRLEIVRVLARRATVIILDEPTAVLAPSEARSVLGLARALAHDDGAAVALVTHRLDEVATHADEVTVLRRGKVVAHHAPGDPAISDVRTLAREALGEADIHVKPRARGVVEDRPAALELAGVTVAATDATEAGGASLREATVRVAAGEIVGIAGVEGNGQSALERVIAGDVRAAAGTVRIGGLDSTAGDVRARRAAGLAWIPSDRHRDGMAEELPVADVARLGALDEVSRRGRVDEAALARAYAEAVAAFDVRPADPSIRAGALSGGNQQKVVVARELRTRARPGRPVRLVLAAQPTRGVDARAAATIRSALVDAADRGAGVLVVSSDLAELRQIADRILVLRGGRLVAELPPTADVDTIGAAMLGAERPPP